MGCTVVACVVTTTSGLSTEPRQESLTATRSHIFQRGLRRIPRGRVQELFDAALEGYAKNDDTI